MGSMGSLAASTIRTYYALTKPGIIYGNILTATAGFLLAASRAHHFDLGLMAATLLGTSMVIAGACVYNNVIDRDLDRHMARTKKRALVTGAVPPRSALIFATVLAIAGFGLLALATNWLVVSVGAIGFVDYIVLYGLAKRRSVYGTLVGSISGATPIVAGYVAVTNHVDGGAIMLFLLMCLWQMPHFYAIALYRYHDYKAAGLPVLPVVRGTRRAQVHIVAYIVAFIGAVLLTSLLGYTGYTFAVVMAGLGLVWLWRGLQGFNTNDAQAWGKSMFLFSLIVVLSLSASVSVGALLP